MKKIAIVSTQYFWLPDEPGPSRFYYIARVFRDSGYMVDVYTSSYEHHSKTQRKKIKSEEFNIFYIDVPGYRKNVDVKREISDLIFCKKFVKSIDHKEYDAVYCSLPPNNVSKIVGRWCHKQHIPFIADIEDLWPEGMRLVFNKPVISSIIFQPFQHDAESTYKYVDGVVGTSEEYTNRATKYNNRSIKKVTVFVGCDVDEFDKEANENLLNVYKSSNEFWITYAGSIGHSYSIDNVVRAAKIIQENGFNNIRFKILGNGPLRKQVEDLSQKIACENVDFLGYTPHPLMAAYLEKSDILVNSFAKGAPQSIVNKVGDYLTAAKPMINTLENKEFCSLVSKYNFGINVEADVPVKLADTIVALLKDQDKRHIMSINARKLAEEKFDRKNSYREIVKLVDGLINDGKA